MRRPSKFTITGTALLYLDCHVHIYPNFDLATLLDAAVANFSRWGADPSPSNGIQGALFLTLTAKDQSYEQILDCALKGLGPWEMPSPNSDGRLGLHNGNSHLSLIPGQQLATTEGLEVHALGTQQHFEDGLSITKTIETINTHGTLAVIPWGAGKWLGSRGKLLAQLIRTPGLDFMLSDSGLRPRLWPRSRLFDLAQQYGRGVIAGTDPLPLANEVGRVGSFGITLDTHDAILTSTNELLTHLRNNLKSQSPMGQGRALAPFLYDQIRIRC
ncbi:MAG: hypothetical protein GXP09_13245 [Gammaproteobacteria bacterium]|nr:hypothetical protein [Gammaproteobacteria bacterium]